MRHGYLFLFSFYVITLSGCQQSALTQMKQDNSVMERQIQEKEQQLSELEIKRKTLEEESAKLQKELEANKLDIDQLSKGLDTLRMENNQIRAATPEQLERKKRTEDRLKEYISEIDALKNTASTSSGETVSKVEKERKIEALKEEIMLYLQFGLE